MQDERNEAEQPEQEVAPAAGEVSQGQDDPGEGEDLGEDDEYDDDEEMEDRPYTSGDFHNVTQKQVLHAVYETLIETKLDWDLVAPFLHTAREMCRSDFETAGTVRIHGVMAEGDALVDAEEAFLEVSIADQDDQEPWLSETFWVSDLILADPEPAQVRNSIRALERSIAKLNEWLAAQEAPSPPPPAAEGEAGGEQPR